jgi:hypothetical protein
MTRNATSSKGQVLQALLDQALRDKTNLGHYGLFPKIMHDNSIN